MQKIYLYQIIIILIAGYFIINRLIRFIKKEKSQSFLKLGAIITIWFSVIFISFFSKLLNNFLNNLGLGVFSLIFIGFIVVFILIFRLLSLIEKLERDITEIVRKEALKPLSKKHEK